MGQDVIPRFSLTLSRIRTELNAVAEELEQADAQAQKGYGRITLDLQEQCEIMDLTLQRY